MTKQEILNDLNRQIQALTDERSRLQQEIASEKFVVKVGDVVSYNGSKWKITRFYGSGMWPMGVKLRKDGTFGETERNLYGYGRSAR